MREENTINWEKIPAKENIEILSGFPFDSKFFNETEGIPLIRIRNLSTNVSETLYSGEYNSDFIIGKGDILIGMDGDFNIVKWKGKKGLLNQRIMKVSGINNSDYNIDFLFYRFQPYLTEIQRKTSATTVKHLSTKDIVNSVFLTPPLPEQQKIAEILTTVDNKIEVIDKQVKQTQELKKGLMQKLLTGEYKIEGGKIGKCNDAFKDSELGKIPESWEVKYLGAFGEFSKGKGISKKELSEDGYPCIRYGEIYTHHDIFIKKFYSFIDESISKQSVKIENNDILFAGSGETVEDIGKSVVYLNDDVAYAGGDIIILKSQNINSLFLAFLLNHELVIKQRSKLGQGNSVVHIYSKELKKILIPIPSKEEQENIARLLKKFDNKFDLLKCKKSEYTELKKGLMQKLLTGKIRVKV
jgi:type I restriction enzyme, S subunit